MSDEAKVEREAILRFLRLHDRNWRVRLDSYTKQGNFGPYLGAPSYSAIADAIEQGQHLQEQSR